MNKITSKVKAVVGKAKGRNNTAPSTEPPPYVHDRTFRLSRLLSVATLTLLLLLSVPALVLKAYGYNFIEINAEMGFYLLNDENQSSPASDSLVAALPYNLFRVPEKFVLVVAMLNILLSMAHLGFVAWDWETGRRTQTRVFRRNAMILHVVNTALVLFALIGLSVAHKDSSTFQYQLIPNEPTAVSPSGYHYHRYDSGIFDLETWTCELKNMRRVGDARKDYSAQCQIETAARMILVPFFLAAITVAGLSVWAFVVGGKQILGSKEVYTKNIDLETGKSFEDGKQVQVEELELDTLRSDRQIDARLSKIEEGAEESDEASNAATPPTTVQALAVGTAENKDKDPKSGANVA